jgi:broad specificity phosphatase PhoE
MPRIRSLRTDTRPHRLVGAFRRTRRSAALLLLLGLLTAPAAEAAAQETTVVLLVRHAERADTPGDDDPPLSDAGRARATALADALGGAGVQAVIVSERQRTRLTAVPLMEAMGIEAEVVSIRGGAAAHADAVADAIRQRHAGRTVLVVGHSNTVGAIINALGAGTVGDFCDWEYDTLHTVVLRAGEPPRLVRSRYGEPSVPADACH